MVQGFMTCPKRFLHDETGKIISLAIWVKRYFDWTITFSQLAIVSEEDFEVLMGDVHFFSLA